MYKCKKDVDKHVESLKLKLSDKEFKTRAYSIARLYFEVGDYVNCQKYVEQYIVTKPNNAAAHKLLGHTLQKRSLNDRALDHLKTSFEIDSTQTVLILDICEILSENDTAIVSGLAKYWCEKAEATFPKHPTTFRLKEKIVTSANSDPEVLIKLLSSEIALRPRDVFLHLRLLKQYLQMNKVKDAFQHSYNVEFSDKTFSENIAWYEILTEVLKRYTENTKDWTYQLLLLTAWERVTSLSISDTFSGQSYSLLKSSDLLQSYDHALELVTKAGAPPGHIEFYTSLLQHHHGQFALIAATFILKRAKNNQLKWSDSTAAAGPLMLISCQSSPVDCQAKWISRSPEKQKYAVTRWHTEGSYRCSQSGHYILSNYEKKNQNFLRLVSEFCSSPYWKDKIYNHLFFNPDQGQKIKSSYFVSNAYMQPVLRLPTKSEIEVYDIDAQKEYPNSLHHFVCILLNYSNYAYFNCTIFESLLPKTQNFTNCGPETLSKLDVEAFLYCATMTAQQKLKQKNHPLSEIPQFFPASITDVICSLPQIKWWDCAYKFSQNLLGSELTDIRSTLSRGIEVVRCVDNHGLDTEIIINLGRIFKEKSNMATTFDDKNHLEGKARLYYTSVLPYLEKLKNKIVIRYPKTRLFDYTSKEIHSKDLEKLIEESKLYVAVNLVRDNLYEKAINILCDLKSPESLYHQSYIFKKMALMENVEDHESKCKYTTFLCKARNIAFKALEMLKDNIKYKNPQLQTEIEDLIEELRTLISQQSIDLSIYTNDGDGKYHSDENASSGESEKIPCHASTLNYRNISSTPKQAVNLTSYRTAMDSHILQNSSDDKQYFERIEAQIKKIQKRDIIMNDFMEQSKDYFEENRKLGIKIINTINNNMQNTTDQLELLKLSVDQVKDECRRECKDVGELKKQVAELRKEIKKLKKTSEQAIDENELYNFSEECRTNENIPKFSQQLPFSTPNVLPPYNQRLLPPFTVPANPYQMYGQNLYSMYPQFSHINPPQVPGGSQMFDSARNQMNYPNMYPSDQMYLDVAHLVPPTTPVIPPAPTQNMPNLTAKSGIANPNILKNAPNLSKGSETKDSARVMPANVVITSSDPLPTCTTAPAPILSVTIPPKHIKGTYQIPVTNEPKIQPPIFDFPKNIEGSLKTEPLFKWNPSNMFNTTEKTDMDKHSFKMGDLTDLAVANTLFNTTPNKSRTYSEKSNTSVENYDPCPDFKPIIPLPDEINVTTGEENEVNIFSSRAVLYRFVDKQWKERGRGEMKLLKHNASGKVRVLMRREQVHKICANHLITPDMELKLLANETKAYFWVAVDFAEETLLPEKFCVRFKTEDIGKQFYEAFEKARFDSKSYAKDINFKGEVDPLKIDTTKSHIEEKEQPKTVIGGFTFSGIPTIKPATVESKPEAKTSEPENKVNMFSGFSFKTSTDASFSNIFKSSVVVPEQKSIDDTNTPNKLNTSDIAEEFEPTAEFKPVVPLPALVNTKTGEEEETILFEHRAKLLRFDSKEWKERGLGNIKILVHKDNPEKVRLLMRREQVMKVCCNHSITKDLSFKKMPKMDTAVTWCAKDFSEGKLLPETFCLRFKTAQVCNDFIEAVTSAQAKLVNEPIKPEQTKSETSSSNTTKINGPITKNSVSASSGWGDKFKPKPGSWECNQCFVRNEGNNTKCNACNSPKDPSAATSNPNTIIPNSSVMSEPTMKASPVSSSWGDKFKPKEGTWECKVCYVRNDSSVNYCSSCTTPNDTNVSINSKVSVDKNVTPKFSFGIPATTEKSSFKSPINNANAISTKQTSLVLDNKVPMFNFGIPATISNEQNVKSEAKSIFDGTGANTFKFGVPSNTQPKDNTVTYGSQPATKESNKENSKQSSLIATDGLQISKENTSFGFLMKPKNQTKEKSPNKHENGNESDGNEYASEDEGHHIHFNPIIPLPDKVEVVTGEENEDELYAHRAKLFRFDLGEWKERGLGIVKILKHKESGKCRVVMRREQIHKICLNHLLLPEINYTPKDDKTWLFTAPDFSEGLISMQQFCLRFKSSDIAQDFKTAVEKAKLDNTITQPTINTKSEDSDEVIFVKVIQSTPEEKLIAEKLMLPPHFFNYKTKEPCKGCRGCTEGDETIEETHKAVFKPSLSHNNSSTPNKTVISHLQSPTSSMYGTPTNVNKSFDNSIFRTPMESNFRSVQSGSTSESNDSDDSTNKENTLTEKLGNFSHVNLKTSAFGNIAVPDTPISGKSSILAPQKLDTSKAEESTSVLGPSKISLFSQSKPLETSGNKMIFGSISNQKDNEDSQKSFGFSLQTPAVSIFGSANESAVKSIFNTTEKPQETKSLFGLGDQKPLFGSANVNAANDSKASNLFANAHQTYNLFGISENKPKVEGSLFGTGASNNQASIWNFDANKISEGNTNGAGKTDIPLKLDSNLSFATLSSSEPPKFSTKTENFKWEGTGQQIFCAPKQLNANSNEAEGGNDEEYDPHYEPIVPMPDEIVVTTGEEDEKKIFSERCKLFRYYETTKEWKERGVGEIKILYHPERNTYRLLLRREQIHKLVLNMRITMDMELLAMKDSDKAWTWAGMNYAEPNGEQEMLAVRFKNTQLANNFKEKVVECVRKLQAAEAQTIRQEKQTKETKTDTVVQLRLPKHLQDSARADFTFSAKVDEQISDASEQLKGTEAAKMGNSQNTSKNIQSQEQYEYEHAEDEEDEEGDEYEDYDDEYYNEDEDASAESFVGHAVISSSEDGKLNKLDCPEAHIEVMLDASTMTPKIRVTDNNTGEILSDMLIHTDTEFQLGDDSTSCSWSGVDHTTRTPIDKSVSVNFADSDSLMHFYDTCETSKAATYSSTDPES